MACFKADYSPEEFPRKLSLCTWTLLPEFPEVLIVPDALQDIRSYPHCLLFAHPLAATLVACTVQLVEELHTGLM